MSDVPAELKYTKDHEWARVEAPDRVRVGITRHAVEALGDVTLVSFDVAAGAKLTVGKTFGTVESVKAVSDLYAPVSGTVIEVNTGLADATEKVNDAPYGEGWMILIAPDGPLDGLMDSAAYEKLLGTL